MTLKGKIPKDKYVVYLDLQNKKYNNNSVMLCISTFEEKISIN